MGISTWFLDRTTEKVVVANLQRGDAEIITVVRAYDDYVLAIGSLGIPVNIPYNALLFFREVLADDAED